MDASPGLNAISTGLITYILIAASLCLRAYAQAWMANRLGDPTPAMEGRLTLNPLPHIDLLGTVILPLVSIFYLQPRLDRISFFLAWAKPVPVNPKSFEHPQKHYLYTLLAETGMSGLLMLIGAITGGIMLRSGSNAVSLAGAVISINAMLVILDFIPIPPLPGALMLVQKGWMREETYFQFARWGGLILIIAFQLPPVRMLLGLLQAVAATPFILLLNLIAG
jgi:Zn-dependent protease